jgi:adenylyl cyclase-associated protein
VVEGQTSQISIDADKVTVKNSVYIFNCVGATIVVPGKCNTITIDGCKNTQVVFQDVLALCEVVNSKGVKIQCKGKAPTVSIDKSDGITVYLSRDTMRETKIVASKSSEMNVSFPGKTDEDAWIEKVIPEQYVHQILENNTVSAEVSDLYSHGG